ncbi:MAG: hypothetical protein QM808_00950 [Steroidobacteraceae bacterium]
MLEAALLLDAAELLLDVDELLEDALETDALLLLELMEVLLELDELTDVFCVELAATTVMAKTGKEVVALPSLTEMRMLLYVPFDLGVPVNAPETVSKLAQPGLLAMLNPSRSPLASLAVGIKL